MAKEKVGKIKESIKDIEKIECFYNFSVKGNATQLPCDEKGMGQMIDDYCVYLSDKEFLKKYSDKISSSFDDDDFDENGSVDEFRVSQEYYITFKDGSEIVVDFYLPDFNFMGADSREAEKGSMAEKYIREFEMDGWDADIDSLVDAVGGKKMEKGGALGERQRVFEITVRKGEESLLSDDNEYEITSLITRALHKKWHGHGSFDVRLSKKVTDRRSAFSITVPRGKESLLSDENEYEFTQLIAHALTKKWFGSGAFDVRKVDEFYDKGGKAGSKKKNPYYVKPISGATRKLFHALDLSVFKRTNNGLVVAEQLKDGHGTGLYGLYTPEGEEVAPAKYQFIDEVVNANGMTRVTHADGSSGAIEAFVDRDDYGKGGEVKTEKEIDELANSLMEKLKEDGRTKRYVNYFGRMVFETIKRNKEKETEGRELYYRYHSADQHSSGIMQNWGLEPKEVLKLYKDSLREKYSAPAMGKGGEVTKKPTGAKWNEFKKKFIESAEGNGSLDKKEAEQLFEDFIHLMVKEFERGEDGYDAWYAYSYKYAVEYRDMHSAIHNIIVTEYPDKNKAEEVLEAVNAIVGSPEEGDMEMNYDILNRIGDVEDSFEINFRHIKIINGKKYYGNDDEIMIINTGAVPDMYAKGGQIKTFRDGIYWLITGDLL